MRSSDESARPSERTVMLPERDARTLNGFEKSFELLTYWQELGSSHRPDRGSIDPLRLGVGLLSHIVLIDVLAEDRDFQWRLFGGAHEREYGVNLKGIRISDLVARNPQVEQVREIFLNCADTKAPIFYEMAYKNQVGCSRAARGLLLPLFAANTDNVDCIISCSEWVDQ
ncbi:MAG: PAS domain-containing protein [Thalassobaculaceae bacterium]|nr:PAS domain-containing protein [Thalassobaculaceae bacterium]